MYSKPLTKGDKGWSQGLPTFLHVFFTLRETSTLNEDLLQHKRGINPKFRKNFNFLLASLS